MGVFSPFLTFVNPDFSAHNPASVETALPHEDYFAKLHPLPLASRRTGNLGRADREEAGVG